MKSPEPQLSARAKEQERVDDLYAKGKITQADWQVLTDNLSANWNADGPVRAEVKPK